MYGKLLKLAEDYQEIFDFFSNFGKSSTPAPQDKKEQKSDLDFFLESAQKMLDQNDKIPTVAPTVAPTVVPKETLPSNSTLDSRSQKNINTLHPKLKPLAELLMQKAAEAKIPIVIVEGFRSNERQQELYEQGRSKPGKKVTNALPGKSLHNHGLAFDVAPLENGQVDYSAKIDWDLLGQIGTSIGLFWGGNFEGFKDKPHFQLKDAWKVARKEPYQP